MFQTITRLRLSEDRAVAQGLREAGVDNLFNPSLQRSEQGLLVAFRGLAKGTEKPFQAFLARMDGSGQLREPVLNLSRLFEPQIGAPVCDPKLFRAQGRCWLTFNTGHFESPNRIFVLAIEPELGPLYRVDLPGRSEHEKNWGFFEHDGRLHALYNVDPLVVLREVGRDEQSIRFAPWPSPSGDQGGGAGSLASQPKLTIGTQPAALDPSGQRYGFITHRRFYWRGKRVYLGKPAVLQTRADGFALQTSPHLWVHSWRALAGDRLKHNPNLLSCSYFSGMMVEGETATISYGINDIGFSIAQMPLSHWGAALPVTGSNVTSDK